MANEDKDPATAASHGEPDGAGAGAGATDAPAAASGGGGAGAPRNPNFAAFVQTPANYGGDENLARLVQDMERGKTEGDADELCVVCERRYISYCNSCRGARYCSRACQVADWPVHKKLCADLSGPAADRNRPSQAHRRILYFPAYSPNPTLIWALHRETPDREYEWIEYNHPDLDRFFSTPGISADDPRAHTVLNLVHSLENRRIGHQLTAVTHNVVRPTGDIVQPAPINRSINELTEPGYLRPTFGPVAFFADARVPDDPGPPKTRDISSRDVHSIVRLIERHDGTCIATPELYHGETVSGLRINDPKTEVSAALGLRRVFDMTSVPLCPAYASDYTIALAFHLGLRWYIRPGNFLGIKSGTTLWSDGNLRYLGFVCTISERTEVAAAAAEATKTTTKTTTTTVETVFNYGPFASSVIVLHGSGRPVDVHHVLAFNAYLDEVYVTKAAASRDGFVRFWADFKQRRGGALASVPSPYKWEKRAVLDRLGYYDPTFVMDQVALHIGDVWTTVAHTLNSFTSHTFEAARP
ncbi:uncharacterized protein P884DRAFT_276704 [Thermothelomyces heterothallicus CBS 202.75]|uniref:uncharacterized protein n=1 Tax=Thermothelomyces heterothallicus CBS 202.75 TaxID=1149848 RepID=UPI0037431E6E